MRPQILITGAGGKTGLAILRALDNHGLSARALVHGPEAAERALQAGALETQIGDQRDPGVLQQAARGIHTILHIAPNMNPDEVEMGLLALQIAKVTGVRRFVYFSVLHPQTQTMPHHWNKLQVEEQIFESGLDFTILQPAAYMQNTLAGWDAIVERGLYRVPYPATTRLGMVDLHDVAQAIARILSEPDHNGAIYELAGPEVLDQNQVAGAFAAALNQPVRVEEIQHQDWQAQARRDGLSEFAIECLLAMFRYYATHGFWGNPRCLEHLLRRPATTFKAFAERVAARQ